MPAEKEGAEVLLCMFGLICFESILSLSNHGKICFESGLNLNIKKNEN